MTRDLAQLEVIETLETEMRTPKSTAVAGIAAGLIALGWSFREAQFAAAAGKRVPSATVNQTDVKMNDADYEGKPTGKAGIIVDGETDGTKSLQVGCFLLPPGQTPHPPHRHVDEELLLVTKGTGEIFCDGKTTQVKPGAVMYTDPNVEHAIKNTGSQMLEFYWVKYVPK
jgi:mannose-6-phosphate isomerase-like protein (cupin superfamily)